MDAPLTSGVGAIAEDVLLDLIVVQDGSGADRKWRTKLRDRKQEVKYK